MIIREAFGHQTKNTLISQHLPPPQANIKHYKK